jgi:hypothetical protein
MDPGGLATTSSEGRGRGGGGVGGGGVGSGVGLAAKGHSRPLKLRISPKTFFLQDAEDLCAKKISHMFLQLKPV